MKDIPKDPLEFAQRVFDAFLGDLADRSAARDTGSYTPRVDAIHEAVRQQKKEPS